MLFCFDLILSMMIRSLIVFVVSFYIFSDFWVGEQSQEWWSEIFNINSMLIWSDSRGGRRRWELNSETETQDWLIETRVRTKDRTLTPTSHMKLLRLLWPLVQILSTAVFISFRFGAIRNRVFKLSSSKKVYHFSIIFCISICQCWDYRALHHPLTWIAQLLWPVVWLYFSTAVFPCFFFFLFFGVC